MLEILSSSDSAWPRHIAIYSHSSKVILSLKIPNRYAFSFTSLEKEILLYVDSLNVPVIVSFNKFEDNEVIKEIVIDDGCCEFCMKGNAESLSRIDGIGSFSFDQDNGYFDVHAKLGYNPNKISEEKLKEIEASLEA